MNFINFQKRIDPNNGKYFYSPNQKKNEVSSVSQPKVSTKNESRTPTKANAGGIKVKRRGGKTSNVYKSVSDVSGGAYKGAIAGRKNKLGAKVTRALQKAAGAVRANPGKTGLALAAAGGLSVIGMKALSARKKKANSPQGRLSRAIKKIGR